MRGGAAAAAVEALLRECPDTVDHVSLEDLSSFAASELLFLALPSPCNPGKAYRCLVWENLVQYAKMSLMRPTAMIRRPAIVDESRGTLRMLAPTYLPGVDFEDRDLEFLLRFVDSARKDEGPHILHVARIAEAPADRVVGSSGSSAHIYEIAEACWERELWQIFDEAMLPARKMCPVGHEVRLKDAAMHLVICDCCERKLLELKRYKCIAGCDFDLCFDCYDKGLDKIKDSVEWLQERLAAFWSQHADFSLPESPPRAIGFPTLSEAVTKWNMFTLNGSDILRLRKTFATSLAARGMQKDLLIPEFWPGCAKQCTLAEQYIELARGERTVSEWWSNATPTVGAVVHCGGDLCRLQQRVHDNSGMRRLQYWVLESGALVQGDLPEAREVDHGKLFTMDRHRGLRSLVAGVIGGSEKPEEQVKLASSEEAMRFHAHRLSLQLADAAWDEEQVGELLDAMAKAMMRGSVMTASRAAAVRGTQPRRLWRRSAEAARALWGLLVEWRVPCLLLVAHVSYTLLTPWFALGRE